MKKTLLASAAILLANLFYVTNAKAEAWLVILGGQSDTWQWPTQIRYFPDDWMSGAERCELALRTIAAGKVKPTFSYCTVKRPVIK